VAISDALAMDNARDRHTITYRGPHLNVRFPLIIFYRTAWNADVV